MILIVDKIPTITPNPNTIRIGKYEKLNVRTSLIELIIVVYKPKINNNVEPEIPGKTIAEIAIIPAIKTYKIKPILRLVNETSIPVPDETGLNTVIATTTKIPVIAQTNI